MNFMALGKRSNVWLGAAGLVINHPGELLVVRKRYGSLKGNGHFQLDLLSQAKQSIKQSSVKT